ncbi:unnamed protein product [Sphagnum compactum]
MESGFTQMVVADTMKKRPFIAILCMHKMQTRAISLGKQQFMFQCIHSSNSITCTTTATHNCHCRLRILNGYQVEATDLVRISSTSRILHSSRMQFL